VSLVGSQVILFGMLAVLVKLRAPTSHTFLEIIQARWGRVAHTIFLCFGLATSIIVTSMLQLGGSSVVNALTGVNLDVASALIPIGVILYTLAGGLRATFVASYFNTAVIMLFLVTFSFVVFTQDKDIGSPNKMWELLQRAGRLHPVSNNQEGSYLTFWVRRVWRGEWTGWHGVCFARAAGIVLALLAAWSFWAGLATPDC